MDLFSSRGEVKGARRGQSETFPSYVALRTGVQKALLTRSAEKRTLT